MKKVIFLTGATGFVGRNLVSRIINASPDNALILLIRGNSDTEIEKRLNQLLSSLTLNLDSLQAKRRISAVRGDITLGKLGLTSDAYHSLASRITHIIHCAASVKFHLPLEEARAINTRGTEEAISLAECASAEGQLAQFAFISTAYVSGNRSGLIRENELDKGQQFSNTYEQSKFEAEKFISQLSDSLPIIIFRPSIVVGDSKTGITSSFNTLYTPLRYIYRGRATSLPGSRHTPLDVVPVDFVSDAIVHILFKSNRNIGKTFHLALGEENDLTAGEIADLAVDYFNRALVRKTIPRIQFIPIEKYQAWIPFLKDQEKSIFDVLKEFEPYLEIKRSFDTSNARAALEGTGIFPPAFNQYYKSLLHYCLSTDWGKRDLNSGLGQLGQSAVF